MAITAIDIYADSGVNAYPAVTPFTPPAGDLPSRLGGTTANMIYFQVTNTTANVAGTDILIGFIPKGYTILFGNVISSAAQGNSGQLSIGLKGADESGFIDAAGTVSDNVAYLKAAAVLTTTLTPFPTTQALGFGYTTEKDLYLTATISVGTASTEVFRGYLSVLPPI